MTTQSECTICLLDYNEETKTKTETECNHIFHQECLDKWLQTNYTCPLCRTELKKDTLCRPIYALPSEQQHRRYNWNRVYPMTLDLSIGLEAVMTEPGYNAEDSIVFGRELIDEGIQPQQMTLHRRENAPEVRQYQRMMIDYLLSQSHPEMLHSGSTGITRVGSPFELNVTRIETSQELANLFVEEPVMQVVSPNTDDNEMYTPYSLGDDLYDEDAYAREVGLYM